MRCLAQEHAGKISLFRDQLEETPQSGARPLEGLLLLRHLVSNALERHLRGRLPGCEENIAQIAEVSVKGAATEVRVSENRRDRSFGKAVAGEHAGGRHDQRPALFGAALVGGLVAVVCPGPPPRLRRSGGQVFARVDA